MLARREQLTTQADHGEESYLGFGRLKLRTALITGGDSGIGRAVAIAHARESADVAFGYLPEGVKDAQETARWVEKAGQRVLHTPADISNQRTYINIIEKVVTEFGTPDMLIKTLLFT